MKPKQIQPRQPSLFDDLDALSREFDEIITGDVHKPEPAREPVRLSKLCVQPDHGDKNFIWKRPEINEDTVATMTIDTFLTVLRHNAARFIWNPVGEGLYLRGWSTKGYSFDPVTAICLIELNLFYSLCITDIAAMRLGLSCNDARTIAAACWNPDVRLMTLHPERREVNQRMISAIEDGCKQV